jgi:zinc/manganese transport system substrate-binding protein
VRSIACASFCAKDALRVTRPNDDGLAVMKILRRHLRLLILFVAAVGAPMHAAGEPPLRVVTLHTVLTEIAREVGGPRVEVTGLVQPGIDPHAFDPSASDMRTLVDADVTLVSGLRLETYLDRLVAQHGPHGHVLIVGDALSGVRSLPGERAALSAREPDPHWWHSIDNVIFATDLVRAEFSRVRPALTDEFARNAKAYEERLIALKGWTDREIARLPQASRHLVTSHDAFGYFARDYGFTVHPIAGISTESEPNAKHLAQLIGLIRAEHIRAVFAETNVNPQLVSNLVSETGVRLGGSLYADGLGPANTDATTFDSMYRHNVRAIVGGLSGP